MVLDNKNMVLYYNLSPDEQELIKSLANGNGVLRTKEITPKMGDMTMKDIIAGLEFFTVNDTLPKDSLILFNNISDDGLSSIINGIREKFKETPIMAVVTETSQGWSFKYLMEHLIEEREWYKNHGK
ncbi:MAG: DUF3783 domain-containing protein [Bacillota bacterium]|nr:DUF3783 domain-containing protein [Bacillota bacterium]